uniref:Uncharacterized protein n=1 Tax=Hyaloperonospora arabidopsidis (strain Emoy2) TaxID=559515 RepID=M4BFY0_HYAAE
MKAFILWRRQRMAFVESCRDKQNFQYPDNSKHGTERFRATCPTISSKGMLMHISIEEEKLVLFDCAALVYIRFDFRITSLWVEMTQICSGSKQSKCIFTFGCLQTGT